MQQKTKLTRDQVDVLEEKVRDVFELVLAHLFEGVNHALAVNGVPHEAIARLNRCLVELEHIRVTSQAITTVELRCGLPRSLH